MNFDKKNIIFFIFTIFIDLICYQIKKTYKMLKSKLILISNIFAFKFLFNIYITIFF